MVQKDFLCKFSKEPRYCCMQWNLNFVWNRINLYIARNKQPVNIFEVKCVI